VDPSSSRPSSQENPAEESRIPPPPRADDRPGGPVRRIYGNLVRLVGGKAGAGLISLAYMLVAVRALGPHDYGVLVLVHTFAITVGGIIEFPGWHAVVRYGAEDLQRGDPARLARLLRFASLVEIGGGAVALVTAAVLGPLIGRKLGWSQTAIDFAVPYAFAVLASIRAAPAGYLQLMRRFDLLGAHVMISPLVRLVGAAAVALAHGGLKGFLVVWLIGATFEWVTMWAMGAHVARRNLGATPLIGPVRGVVAEHPGIWRFMIGANADQTLSDLAPRLTPLVIGWIMGPTAAGLFAVAQRATVVISQPAQLLGQAAYAEFAKLIAAGGRGRPLRQALARCVGLAMLIAIPALIVIGFAAHPLADLIGGKAFDRAGDVMLLLAIARAILLVGPPASAALVAMGRPGLSVAANLIGAVGLLPALPLFVDLFGLAGAGWQAVAQAVVSASLVAWFVVRASGRAPAPKP
jgi:O-antigen/teichoic acid export membrane protein